MPDKVYDKTRAAPPPWPGRGNPSPSLPNNAASNGYWVHDDIGPRHYVAPPSGNGGDALPMADLFSRINEALCRDVRFRRVHVDIEEGEVVMFGIVTSEADRTAAAAAVQAAATGLRVTNHLAVDNLLQPGGGAR